MSENAKYSWVNALRGYAILLVILIHSAQSFSVFDYILKVSNSGYLGVQLFFILSSFTLFNSYSRRNSEDGKFVKSKFFIRRLFRIAPYYYTAMLIYILYRVLIKNESVNIKNIVANATFINGVYLPAMIGNVPPGGWSIGVEMLFYLFIPLLFRYINSLKEAMFFLVLTLILSFLINEFYFEFTVSVVNSIWENTNTYLFYFWLPNQFPIFALGIVLYFINKEVLFSFKMGQVFLILSLGAFFILPFVEDINQYSFNIIKKEYVYSIVFLFFAIGVYTTKNKYLNNSFIQKIGIVSFSMYLNHFLLLIILGYLYSGSIKFFVEYMHFSELLFRNNIVFLITYVIVVFLSYFVSQFTYEKVELKGINLGKQFISKFVNEKDSLCFSYPIKEEEK
ncbi:hypothetical protein FFWV33_07895 [Flavobacterium faecale]|uniref:Acyltransferase 3 domain-containing protein n=1 Tax=Flavobacterium faecale TaxID=1355330 RepID=A0A2S1LCM4_9FLAO|nr:acyltransferase [Flavobacterium faecale]AWG21461.1 hypothetical protein FFWV33_07895 [Flavobacterium faecale]